MDIQEKQKMLNDAFMRMSEEAQDIVLKLVLAFAQKHPKKHQLKLIVVNDRSK